MNKYQNNALIKFLLLLIIYINIFGILNYPKPLNIIKKVSQPKNFTKPPKLYNSVKNNFLLIIGDYENLKLNELKIKFNISFFLNRTMIDIIFVFLFPNIINKKIIQSFSNVGNNIEIYKLKFNKWILNIIDIINTRNSKYVIITDKILKLNKNDVYGLYNITKGNKNNIFKFKTKEGYNLYLIRTKILRDILDFNNKFENIHEIIKFLYSYPLPKLNYIPISFCSDNNYINYCYTSMLSVLDSKRFFSFIIFYIIIPKDLTERNIKFLESLYEQYDYFNITFLRMDDRWNNAFTIRYLTIHTYFRYSLAEMIPNLNKIIYIDVDTICLTDLSDFYDLNFRGKIILGRVAKTNKIDNKKYYTINAGILLLNLKEMRKMKMEKKLLKIVNNGFGNKDISTEKGYNNYTSLIMPGQALLNLYFYKYIGLFPPKYNAKDISSYEKIIKKNKDFGNLYDNDYLYFSFNIPSIKHFSGSKEKLFFNKFWKYYARKSKYFNIISKNISIIYNYSFNPF